MTPFDVASKSRSRRGARRRSGRSPHRAARAFVRGRRSFPPQRAAGVVLRTGYPDSPRVRSAPAFPGSRSSFPVTRPRRRESSRDVSACGRNGSAAHSGGTVQESHLLPRRAADSVVANDGIEPPAARQSVWGAASRRTCGSGRPTPAPSPDRAARVEMLRGGPPWRSASHEPLCVTPSAGGRRGHRHHGAQVRLSPFDKLNVDGVQNAAALRYQIW